MKEVIQRGPDETGVTLSAPGSPNRQAGEYDKLASSTLCIYTVVTPICARHLQVALQSSHA